MASMRDFINSRKAQQQQSNPEPAKPTDSGERLTYRCGHSIPRTKFEEKHCPKCRAEHKRNKNQRRLVRQAEAKTDNIQRLPDGSSYQKKYDATSQMWVVTLIIPLDGETKHFTATGSGSMKTEFECDALWRAWLATK
jgi:hypothetical protein